MAKNNKGLAKNKEEYKKNQPKSKISKKNLTDEVTNAFGNYLKDTNQESNELEYEKQTYESEFIRYFALKIKDEHNKTIDSVISNVLAPELSINEKQKRSIKRNLIIYILIVLSFQLLAFLSIIFVVLILVHNNPSILQNISNEKIEYIVRFLIFYISAVIAEFIAMLFFIVRFAFDKSIVDLIMQIFKKKD